MRRILTISLIVAVLVSALAVGFAVAQSYTYVVTLVRGQSAYVTCDGAQRLRADRQSELIMALSCGKAEQAQPTPTATTPAEPTATPTAQPPSGMIDMYWHPPMAHGDRPFHEHGDPVPQWVIDAGYNPVFGGMSSTPAENMLNYKHTAFKQWAGRFNGQDWFGVFHLDFQPSGRTSRFHGYQLYVKDATGAVSAIMGWLDFGTGNNTGPNLLPSCGQDSAVRPIMNPTEPGCPIQFESWYARAGSNGDWAPDFGFNINSNYYHGGDPADPATWTPTGGIRNIERRIEFAWYLGGQGIRPSPRGEFYATQWGDIVSGTADPVCGTQRTYGDRSYTVLCLRQYVAPTVQPMTFPGNAVQRTFPGEGVELPN